MSTIGALIRENRILPRARVSRLCSSTTNALGRRIMSGTLKPGDAMPTEAVLCGELGVSRTTLREAVKRLHGKGLVDGGPRTGMRVLPTDCWNQFDADVLGWRAENGFDAEIADQLYEVRGCVEPQACRMAAVRAEPSERERILALYAQLETEASSVAAHVAVDIEFHLTIFTASHNPFLISLGSAIRTGLELAFRASQQRRRISESELRLHGRIAQAIARGRPEPAATAMKQLLRESRLALG